MYTPPSEVHSACLRAALATTVPISLLEALAFVASSYNPLKEGPARGNEGAPGKGLFLLGPRVLEQLHVSDPFSAAQNARAAADVLRALGDRYSWAEDSMVVGFVWGGAKLSKWMALPMTSPDKPLPAAVKAKIEEVRAARAWLLERAQAVGSSDAERLDNAIRGAAAANAAWPPAAKLVDQWNLMLGTQRTARTPSALNAAGLQRAWTAYRDGFLRLPVTDSRTPLPARVQPGSSKPAASSPPPSSPARPSSSPPFSLSGPAVGGLLLLGVLGFRSGRRRSLA